MNKILLLLTFFSIAVNSSMAQLADWSISPCYESVEMKEDGKILVTDSAGWTILWSPEGQRLFSTEEKLMPFQDGVATVIKKMSPVITGFVDLNGKFTELPNLYIAYDYPYFDNDLITIKKPLNGNDKYEYYNKFANIENFETVVQQYPFSKGFAPYFTYDNIIKNKDPHYGYYRSDKSPMQYRMSNYKNEVKDFDVKDLAFVSRIGSNKMGVAVIKDKLYWYDIVRDIFVPMLWGNAESEKKRHLHLVGDYENFNMYCNVDTIKIIAKYGNKQMAELRFDQALTPLIFTFDGEDVDYRDIKPKEKTPQTNLSKTNSNGYFGLKTQDIEIFPPQFQEIDLLYGNRAFVKHNGKWGVIQTFPEKRYILSLNKGEDIPFRHQKFETQLRLDLPPEISAKAVRLDQPLSSKFIIDKTSREYKDTESGNFLTYNCTLTIPDSLPDVRTNIEYGPFTVENDGINLFGATVNSRAWHLKYYNVETIDEKEISIQDGNVTFTFNISVDRLTGERDYPFDVKIQADSLDVEKISEIRYKCIVYNIQPGRNNLNIYVTEEGCPSSIFPLVIEYTKAEPRKKEKEKVVIRKKSQREIEEESKTPILEI